MSFKKIMESLAGVSLIVFAISFVLFFAAYLWFHGNTDFDGTIKDGHYYLRSHSGITEVSEKVWRYSNWLLLSFNFTFFASVVTQVAYWATNKIGKKNI